MAAAWCDLAKSSAVASPISQADTEAKTIIDSQNRKPLESLDGTYMGQSSKNEDVIDFNGA